MADQVEIDIFNRHLVGMQAGGWVVVSLPPARLTVAEARSFAAWVVVIAEIAEMVSGQAAPTFEAYLEAVRNT